MTGYELLTTAQRKELDNITERHTHAATMRFSAIDSATLKGYKELMANLEKEYAKEQSL